MNETFSTDNDGATVRLVRRVPCPAGIERPDVFPHTLTPEAAAALGRELIAAAERAIAHRNQTEIAAIAGLKAERSEAEAFLKKINARIAKAEQLRDGTAEGEPGHG